MRGSDIRNGTIRGKDTAGPLGFHCPHGTKYHEGACIETGLRPAALTWANSRASCQSAHRRLPTLAELENFRLRHGITLASNGEWAGDRRETINDAGAVDLSPGGGGATRLYRCVATAG